MDAVVKMALAEDSESALFNSISTIKSRICHVCELERSKYKCSTCEIPYCSLVCYKRHKDTPCIKPNKVRQFTIPDVPDVNKNGDNKNGDEDPVNISEEILQNLGRSERVKKSLCNSDLRKILSWINNSKDAHAAIHTAMMEPIFVDFVDECLNIVDKIDADEEMSD